MKVVPYSLQGNKAVEQVKQMVRLTILNRFTQFKKTKRFSSSTLSIETIKWLNHSIRVLPVFTIYPILLRVLSMTIFSLILRAKASRVTYILLVGM